MLLLNPRLPEAERGRLLVAEFPDKPGHVWIASSGSSGITKVAALSFAALEASASAVNTHLAAGPADCWLNALPLFHVGGLGVMVRAALTGSRCEFLPRWNPAEFVRAIETQRATLSALVPAQVHDLLSANLRCPSTLRAVVVGGAALEEGMLARGNELGWPFLPSYGMTETCSQVATAARGAGDASWLPLLGHCEARVGEGSLLELRGPSLLSGWMLFPAAAPARWEDPKVDGWFRTSDRVELRARCLRFLGRADDLVKIRGELVDVAALEQALQARVPSGLVRIDLGADERNGAFLTVVAENVAAEAEAKEAIAGKFFPPYARPADCRVGPVALTALGKKVRPTL